jgi:aspartate/tyrosine/aromatic aminotransferase
MQSRSVVQEEMLLNLLKQANSKKTSKQFEPIRGIQGLANFLGVSPVTAQKLKNSGKIPYVQFERIVLFDPKKVMDALESINYTKR